MATTISTQDIVDAKRDIDDIGKAVNENVIVDPRYGDDFKSLPMIAAEAQATIGEWESAIALITQEGGVPALAVSDDGGETQQKINNEITRFFTSLSELLSYKPKNNGQLVKLSSYHSGGQHGGSDLIAIQSGILIENGVTVFRSNVVGYEDYFWVRVNISHITPEMAGAIGDKTYNCREAFRACFSVGGKIKLRENAKYLLSSEGLTAAAGETIILIDAYQNFELVCDGWAEMYFKSEHPSNIVISAYFNNTNLTLTNAKIRNVGWFGHTEIGHPTIANRTYCPHFVGTHNPDLKNIRSSTFRSHTIHFTRRIADWIQSSDLNQANTEAAVNRLMGNSCKNVKLRNIRVDNCGSTGISMFGVDGLDASGIRADMAGALYDLAIWTDDASSQTKLADYSLNRNIHIRDVVGGSIDLTGCVSGSVSDCDLKKINVRSYDFDQQKDNFDSGTHAYNPADHISQPFMWQKWFKRGITLHDNFVDRIEIRSIYVDAHDNFIRTTAANQSLIVTDRNGIRWGTGVDYFDEDKTASGGIKNNIRENTFIVKHSGCIGIDFGTASANSFINAIDNIIEKDDPALTFTHMRYGNQNFRRDSFYNTSVNGGYMLSKRVNYHIDVRHGLLTQGVGSNSIKTAGNIYANAAAQPIAAFTNSTTSVFFWVNIFDQAGRYFRKKIEVLPDNTRVVTDLDSQTIYNTSFTVSVASGVITLSLLPSTYDLSFELTGIGSRSNCSFSEPPVRLTSTG